MSEISDQEIVVIDWTDAAMHGSDQRSRDEAVKECGLMRGVSVGLIVYEDDDQITIALDWFPENDSFRQIASYPKSGIRLITRRRLQQGDT